MTRFYYGALTPDSADRLTARELSEYHVQYQQAMREAATSG